MHRGASPPSADGRRLEHTQAPRRGAALRRVHLALPRSPAPPLAAWLDPPRVHPRAALPRARRAALLALLAQAAPAPAAEPARRRAANGSDCRLRTRRSKSCASNLAGVPAYRELVSLRTAHMHPVVVEEDRRGGVQGPAPRTVPCIEYALLTVPYTGCFG